MKIIDQKLAIAKQPEHSSLNQHILTNKDKEKADLSGIGIFSNSTFQQLESKIQNLQKQIFQNKNTSYRDLILLQIQMGRYNLRVEVAARFADSISATFRKLQG